MSIFEDDLQYRNITGATDLNDLVAPGNYFVEEVTGTNLPLEEPGYLTVREQQGKTSLFQSYLGQQSSRLFTRTATGGFNGESDTLTIISNSGDPVTATITPRPEGLSFYATGGNLNGYESNTAGTDTIEGIIMLEMDTSGMGGITINGTNAVMIWGGTVMIVNNTISTNCGTFVIDGATATASSVEIRFSYQWTAEMGRERTWTEWQRNWCNCPPAIQIVTISFDADGGTPIPNTILVVPGQAFTVPAGPTKDDYAFNGWKAQGSSMIYQPGQTVNTNVNMHLVAQWEEQSAQNYVLSFDSAGGEPVPANIVVTIGMSAVLPAAPSRDDYSFTGWRDEGGTLYQPGRQISPESDMQFAAQWQQIGDQQEGEINVYFLTEGADYPILMAAEPHTDFTLPDYAPQMEGHSFVKWLSDDFTTEYMPGDTIHMGTESIYLSAVWHIYESYQTTEKMLKSQNYLCGTVEISEDNLTIYNVMGMETTTYSTVERAYQVDWGDGMVETIMAPKKLAQASQTSHTYSRSGRYKVRLWTSDGSNWVGFRRSPSLQSSDVLVSIDYYKTTLSQSAKDIASDYSKLVNINCPLLWKGTPRLYSMEKAFSQCVSLTGKNDFTGHAFNKHTVGIHMRELFDGCISLDPKWSIKAFSNILLVNITGIFQNCSSMTHAPVNFGASSSGLVQCSNAFKEARSMENLPLNINLSSITNSGATTASMFMDCHNIEGSAMDIISKITDWDNCNTSQMFAGCTSLSDYDQIPGRFL